MGYEADPAENRRWKRWFGGCAFGKSRPGNGTVYGASQGSSEGVAGGDDGAFIAAAAPCAHLRCSLLYDTLGGQCFSDQTVLR